MLYRSPCVTRLSRTAVSFYCFAEIGGVFIQYKVVHRAAGQGSAGYNMALYLMLPRNTVRTESGWNDASGLHSQLLGNITAPC